MRRWFVLAALCVLLPVLPGCFVYRTPVMPPQGFIYTKVSAPLSISFDKTPVCEKAGQASTLYFRDPLFTGLSFAWDKADLASAAAQGNLSTVEYADYEIMSILGIYGRFTVKAYGSELAPTGPPQVRDR